jgi:propionyl-CoA carboxylase alpha chain
MITRLLVANRGEVARRVFATCRRLGIETVAVHSDADAGLPFVREADHAVRLPGQAPADTYLRADLVLDAARRAGADAVHPGYGFLSENADFARAVLDAGLTWVGPAPASIDAMGSKVAAKKLMESAGVPVLFSLAVETATEADLPLLVKASAGGGGRGMRVVRTLVELPDQVALAAAEAESAFGDATVFVEPYVEHCRHVEVQVVGHSGGVLVLGERDCSLQRRHQKVIEETPAPGLSDATRAGLHEAARAAAAAIDYQGAGTVEFLVDAADPSRFWFLEMNTRLQVEHPVTEAVFGVDLVELQLAVAETGSCVPAGAGAHSGPHEPVGHAIEGRLYAEDPAADYQPQSGVIATLDIRGVRAEFTSPASYGLRLDSGFGPGDEVGTHYDAMVAKLVSWAPTREQAARQLAGALADARVHGLTTNRDQLVRSLRHPAFLAGEVETGFFDEHPEVVTAAPTAPTSRVRLAATAAAIALAEEARARRTVQRGIPVAWRNVVSQPQVTRFRHGDVEIEVGWYGGRDGFRIADDSVQVGPGLALTAEGVTTRFDVDIRGDVVDVDSALGHVALHVLPRFTDPADQVASGSLLAPMPGTVIRVDVEQGQQVEAGQAVLVLEAMKMQQTVSAPHAGTVTELPVVAGQQVAAGDVLAVVDEEQA